MNTLNPGQDFDELPESYVIFITRDDIRGYGFPIYHIDRHIKEADDSFQDEAHIIYVNSRKQEDTELGRLMHDLHCKNADEMHSPVLAKRVHELKDTQKGVELMCHAVSYTHLVARAGIKIRMLLINPVFSTELLYELLKDEESLALLLKQDLMELVNYLSEFCKETESLNKKQLEELSRHPKEIRNGLEVVLTQIPKEWQASFLHLWLWNESLYADIPKLIRFLTGPDADFEKVSNGKAAYVNTLYGNPLPDMDLYELTLEKTELILYAITKRKKNFLELLRKNGCLLYTSRCV